MIQRLGSEVVDQIAAGEVLERPANLVKELVENSLDAGATDIEVHSADGGRRITVVDNGSGIAGDELALALVRHATSKIRASDDLWKLTTFGFRGEALASAAAVSRIRLISRQKGSETGYEIRSAFGVLSDVVAVGSDYGTRIEVEELFENVPARLKFLKSDSAETLQIKKILRAFGLSNPNVEFRFYVDSLMVLHWPKAIDAKSRVENILDHEPLFFAEKKDGESSVRAYFTSPNDVEKTSQQIWLFVNSRWVQDKSLQTAVLEAYRNLLMHGEYPAAYIDVRVPPHEVDVNVHPSKSLVKFEDQKRIWKLVHYCIRHELEKAPWLEHVLGAQTNASSPVYQPRLEEQSTGEVQAELGQGFEVVRPTQSGANFKTKSWMQTLTSVRADQQAEEIKAVEVKPLDVKPTWSGLQVLGQAHLTYILAQSARGLLLIDQHAAHERVNFEKLNRAYREKIRLETQPFLIPLTIDLPSAKVEAILSAKDDLESFGISIEQGGPEHILVSSCPAILKEHAVVKSLEKLADEILENGGSAALEKKMGDVLATMACHSSVRAGQALSIEEMSSLLTQMDEFPLSSFCPHGRPVFVEYSFRDIDTAFGRIV